MLSGENRSIIKLYNTKFTSLNINTDVVDRLCYANIACVSAIMMTVLSTAYCSCVVLSVTLSGISVVEEMIEIADKSVYVFLTMDFRSRTKHMLNMIAKISNAMP